MAMSTMFFRRISFVWSDAHVPTSSMAKPLCMEKTPMAPTMSQIVSRFAPSAAVSSSSRPQLHWALSSSIFAYVRNWSAIARRSDASWTSGSASMDQSPGFDASGAELARPPRFFGGGFGASPPSDSSSGALAAPWFALR